MSDVLLQPLEHFLNDTWAVIQGQAFWNESTPSISTFQSKIEGLLDPLTGLLQEIASNLKKSVSFWKQQTVN